MKRARERKRTTADLVVPEVVQMSENAHHAREAVRLKDVQELERLHLETEARVDQQQHQICHLRRHAVRQNTDARGGDVILSLGVLKKR
jgi:mannose-6-phosphate isomerase class I